MTHSETIIEDKFTEDNLLAEEAITAENHQQAAQILLSIIDKDPQNWRAFNNLGVLSWVRQNWQDAYYLFVKSVSINPVYVDALQNLFDASIKLKKVQEIIPFFENALYLNPNLEEIKIVRDNIIEQGNKIYLSPKALTIGIYSAILDDAERELESENFMKAIDLFLKSIDSEGPSARAFGGLGIINFYLKRFDDALSLFVESIKLNPIDSEMFENMLDAAKECNKVPLAKEIFALYRNTFQSLEKIADIFENSK